jgi:hypothetical protein
MSLKDVTGVFSRYFIIGFFLPSFFALVVLWQLATQALLPEEFREYSSGVQLAVIGGVALFVALLLSGLHYTVLRLFEGYPLRYEPIEDPVLGQDDGTSWQRARSKLLRTLGGAIRSVREWKTKHWQERYSRLVQLKNSPNPSDERTRAAHLLARYYPDSGKLLPTRFGNAIRSFEWHPRQRWGLDGVTIWPRIELLLGEKEQELIADARGEVAFFINSAVGGIGVGITLVIDEILHSALAWYLVWLYPLPFVFSYLMYRAAVGAAVRWGESVRAGFDLHRLELFNRLGVKIPESRTEELAVGRAINRCLLYGETIPNQFRSQVQPEKTLG